MNRRPSSGKGDGSFIADARAGLDDVKSVVGEQFDTGEAGEDVDTLGGYLVTQVGRLPVEAKSFPAPVSLKLKCSMPIHGASSACASALERTSSNPRLRERRSRSYGRCRDPPPSDASSSLLGRHRRKPMTFLRAFIAGIILSWGWRRAAIASIVGALSALAVAPFNAWPVLFITIPVTVLADRRRWRRASRWHTGRRRERLVVRLPDILSRASTGSVTHSLLMPQTFAWLLPVAVMGLPALLALFMALALGLRG